MLDKFAEEIKLLRENKNLTLLQVAQFTRIDIKFLEYIEEGDFSFQPDLYIKAFIKDYIKALDEDPVLYLKKYEAAKQGKVYEEPIKQEKSKKPAISNETDGAVPLNLDSVDEKKPDKYIETPIEYPKITKTEPIKPKVSKTSFNAVSTGYSPVEYSSGGFDKQWFIIAAIGIVFVIIIAVYFLFFKSDSNKIIVENSYQTEVAENTNRYVAPEQTPANNSTSMISSDSLSLEIKSSEKTWMSLKLDSIKAKEITLKSDETLKVSAKSTINIFTSKAKLLQLTLNGKPLQFTPSSNRAKLLINKDGASEIQNSNSDNTSNGK